MDLVNFSGEKPYPQTIGDAVRALIGLVDGVEIWVDHLVTNS
jgi:hypothetical protein